MADDCPRASDLGPLRTILQRYVGTEVRRRAYALAVDMQRLDALETLENLSDTSEPLTGKEIPDDLVLPLDDH